VKAELLSKVVSLTYSALSNPARASTWQETPANPSSPTNLHVVQGGLQQADKVRLGPVKVLFRSESQWNNAVQMCTEFT